MGYMRNHNQSILYNFISPFSFGHKLHSEEYIDWSETEPWSLLCMPTAGRAP